MTNVGRDSVSIGTVNNSETVLLDLNVFVDIDVGAWPRRSKGCKVSL